MKEYNPQPPIRCGPYYFQNVSEAIKFSSPIYCEVKLRFSEFRKNIINAAPDKEVLCADDYFTIPVGTEVFLNSGIYPDHASAHLAVLGYLPNRTTPIRSAGILVDTSCNSFFFVPIEHIFISSEPKDASVLVAACLKDLNKWLAYIVEEGLSVSEFFMPKSKTKGTGTFNPTTSDRKLRSPRKAALSAKMRINDQLSPKSPRGKLSFEENTVADSSVIAGLQLQLDAVNTKVKALEANSKRQKQHLDGAVKRLSVLEALVKNMRTIPAEDLQMIKAEPVPNEKSGGGGVKGNVREFQFQRLGMQKKTQNQVQNNKLPQLFLATFLISSKTNELPHNSHWQYPSPLVAMHQWGCRMQLWVPYSR